MKLFTKIPIICCSLLTVLTLQSCNNPAEELLLKDMDWESFLSQHDMHWSELTADPEEPKVDGPLQTGYYAGAIMGNGLLGTNLYKLHDNVYRLNVGRSDITEVRKPYDLYNSARLPIGYFTLATVGKVQKEEMRLSLYNAETKGTFTTDQGSIHFNTYVHALHDYIVFETQAQGKEKDYNWNFIAQKAISPRYILNKQAPANYLNYRGDANPPAEYHTEGENRFLIQALATDSSMTTIGKVYVVAWREKKSDDKRRIIATVAFEKNRDNAMRKAVNTLNKAFQESAEELQESHHDWWNRFYRQAAFLSFPDARMESLYWSQYYKFASTTRPGKPIVDLQGVWPTWDTPWTAVWINLNLQLTYSWQTKANLGWMTESLWNALDAHKDNLHRNVTDIPGQETWTDAACLGRTSSYDFLSPLNPKLVESNQYEVGNLTWLLLYYWQYCTVYGKTEQLTEKFFPLLKSAINLYFHIRIEKDGKYSLPATASPEYLKSNVGPNTNYDLASLRWGLQTLIDINNQYQLNDPQLPRWQDFLAHLVDYPYDEETGYKVSDSIKFENVNHRHYSHLFMIYPYYLVHWGQKENREKISLSVNRWKGNQGYSRTGKACMLLSMGKGDEALKEMEIFLNKFVKPNTLYAETGPVIETPFAAISALHDFYMQDWGKAIRIFHGIPSQWNEASFVNMRATGGFLVSANRNNGKTTYIRIISECGNTCTLQTDIPLPQLNLSKNGQKQSYKIIDKENGIIEFSSSKGDAFEITNCTEPAIMPTAIEHPNKKFFYYGDGKQNSGEVPAKQS